MEKISPTIAFKLLLLVGLMFCIPLISAVPPQQISDTTLQLESAFPSVHKLGEDYYVHTHVYNTVDEGLITSGISCYYHFYNHQINGGEHISTGNLTQYDMGWFNIVNGSLINQTGEYSTLIWCNSSTEVGFNKYTFEVTENGKASPEGIVIAVFVLAFILVFALSILSFIKSLGNTLEMKMDLLDATFMMVTYLGVWMFYYFSIEYLANPLVNDILELMISVGWITHIFLPIIGFAVSYIMTTLKFKQKARITY